MLSQRWWFVGLLLLLGDRPSFCAAGDQLPEFWREGKFRWRSTGPLVAPPTSPTDHYYSIKDPSIVYHDGQWHLFCTVRGQKRSHQIEYLRLNSLTNSTASVRRMLSMHAGYYCAPQVFYFAPEKIWYLICQASDESWQPKYQAAYATTHDLADPDSWSPLRPLGARPAGDKAGLDFWIIFDRDKAHLFFATLDGHLWREETTQFPHGWSEPVLAIEGDIFEASHTYRLKGTDKFVTLVEAQNGRGWRYYKAYLADRLEGPWAACAAGKDHAFAYMLNVEQAEPRWTDSISHGELIRSGVDEHLEVDPGRLRFLIQGVLEKDRAGKSYGEIPWQLGILSLEGDASN